MKTVDELISEIAECLAQWDGESIVGIANQVLTTQHEYVGDDMVEERGNEEHRRSGSQG